MVKEFVALDEIRTIAALNFCKRTLILLELLISLQIQIQVVVKLPQLSPPLTTFFLVNTVNFESIERLLETQVREIIETTFIAARAWLVATLHPLNTQPTEALSTAGHLVRFSKDIEANGTLTLKVVSRGFHKFTLKSNLVLGYRHFVFQVESHDDIPVIYA